MSSISSITQLLQSGSLWQGSQKTCQRPVITSGYPALDKVLHYSGWPQGALSELLLSQNGIGELRLLLPLLTRLSLKPGYISWINPPYLPYAPALSLHKLALEKLVITRASTLPDSVWAAQQAMASGACSAVLLWLPAKTLTSEVRKLTLAAKNANCWGFILRCHSMQQQASSAVLRIVMRPNGLHRQLNIIKQPGGWSGQQVSLDLFPERVYWNAQAARHWPDLPVAMTDTPQKERSAITSLTQPDPIQTRLAQNDNQTTLSASYH